MATAKIIELLLDDGTLEGLLTVQDSNWNGTMFVSPRDSIKKLILKRETSFWGVYLLLSDDGVYIGQASELQIRLKQHDKTKEFWSKCVLITTKDDSLNRSAIDYIEANFIERAKKIGQLHIENKQKGNKTNVNAFEKVRYDNFIENAILLLELIGITVFKENLIQEREITQSAMLSPKFYIELTDGFKYQGNTNRDYFLRTIEHLAETYPSIFQSLKNNFKSKKGRSYISDEQEYSSKSKTALYSKIKSGEYIYTNQSADSLKSNLNQYLNYFGISRLI